MKIWNGYKRGINLGGWLSQCPYNQAHYDSFINENDIKTIALWGLDHVRLPIDYEVIESHGFKYIDEAIGWCRKNNLNIILDLHKAPGYSFNDPNTNSLFGDEKLKKRFVELWKQFAQRYSTLDGCVTFELLNEIVEKDSIRWNSLAYRAITEIRKYAPDIKIVIGGIQWNSAHTLELLDLPYDDNIVYTFHFYEPFLFTHQKAHWVEQMPKGNMEYPGDIDEYRKISKELHCFGSGLNNPGINKMGKEFFKSLIMCAVNVANDRNTYLYCGEYGIIEHAPSKSIVNWYTDSNSVFEEFNIGRAAWTYKSKDFGISDLYDSSILPEIVKKL